MPGPKDEIATRLARIEATIATIGHDGGSALEVHVPARSIPTVAPALAVRPRVAWQLLGCGNTFGYELLARGELDSYLDGSARKITMASIEAYVARRLESAGKSSNWPTENAPASRGRLKKRSTAKRTMPT